MRARRHFLPSRQRGMGIVETMVGILIGMVVLVAVYNVFSVSEGYKRTAVGASDAQATGLFAQFVLTREIANAGNGLSGGAPQFGTCTVADANWFAPAGFFGGAKPIRPVPIVIQDGGAPELPDSMIVTYSTAPHVVSPMLLVDVPMAALTDPVYVQSPNGYRNGDRIILNDMAGNCEITTATTVTPGSSTGDLTTGFVRLDHPVTAHFYKTSGTQNGPNVFNLGQPGEATRTFVDVVNGQLRTTDLLTPGATANPIAQNVVLIKAQYGVDCALPPAPPSGVILWTAAVGGGPCGRGYAPDNVVDPVMFPPTALATIRAVRVAIVVRSDEPELLVNGVDNVALKSQTAFLFNCSANTNAGCPGRIALDKKILTDYYRFRIYETVVPMRNAIFNNGL